MASSNETKEVIKMIEDNYNGKYSHVLYDKHYDVYTCYSEPLLKKYKIEQSNLLFNKLQSYAMKNMKGFEELTPNFNTHTVIQNYINNMFFNALLSRRLNILFRTNVFYFDKYKKEIILVTSDNILNKIFNGDCFEKEKKVIGNEITLLYKK